MRRREGIRRNRKRQKKDRNRDSDHNCTKASATIHKRVEGRKKEEKRRTEKKKKKTKKVKGSN